MANLRKILLYIQTYILLAHLADRHLITTKNDKKLFFNENSKNWQNSLKQTQINFIETIVMEVPRAAQMKKKD